MRRLLRLKIYSGFSLLEVILVVSLIVVFAGILIPSFRGAAFSSDLVVARDIVEQAVNQAQSLARSGEGDSGWGVRLAMGQVTVFRGNDFLNRDVSFDRVFKVADEILFQQNNELLFDKFTGLPQQLYLVGITNLGGDLITISVNSQGVVDY